MMKPSITQSQKRHAESLGALFKKIPSDTSEMKCVFIKSSTDIGVTRNGGRNGARFAPQSFLSVFKKMAQCESTRGWSFYEEEVASIEDEKKHFLEGQKAEKDRIQLAMTKYPNAFFCHLGGGHDHILPFALAMAEGFTKTIIINVDAHADTRTDEEGHSGTPFRQLSELFQGEMHLFQIGLNRFSNSSSTLSPLNKGQMHILWRDQLANIEQEKTFFGRINQLIDAKTLVIFSLDADALDGSEVPGVSAVNAKGISMDDLERLGKYYRALNFSHAPAIGIYELNPLYDDLSMLSMRKMAAFIYGIF